jgi:hypothetical protein
VLLSHLGNQLFAGNVFDTYNVHEEAWNDQNEVLVCFEKFVSCKNSERSFCPLSYFAAS